MSNETFIQRVKTYVRANEGYKNYVYKDSRGFLSMGYGHKLTEEEKKKYKLGDMVDEKLLEDYWEKDWNIHYAAAQKIPGYNSLNDDQKEVLIDLTFNMGVNWMDKFPNMMKNILLASQTNNPNMKKKYISLAAAELKYKNYEKDNLETTKYWNQVKSRAWKNFDKLMGNYDQPDILNYGSYDNEFGLDAEELMRPAEMPNFADDATFGRRGY